MWNVQPQVQRTIGVSDYVRRDMALKNLIQPLAGEYGMHNNQPQLKTHRLVLGVLVPGGEADGLACMHPHSARQPYQQQFHHGSGVVPVNGLARAWVD